MNWLANNWVWVALLAATLLVLLLLALVVSAALRRGGESGGVAAKTLRLLGTRSLSRSFRQAVKLIEANLASGSERYNLSWTLVLNGSAGADVPLAQSGLSSALAQDTGLEAAAQGIAWNFFDKGVVVQLRTDYLGAAGTEGTPAGDDGVWDAFLDLCRNYRPERPFDAIVLAIPGAALAARDPQDELAIVARAQALHRRLWLAQNRLALRFPIHIVVSECERIPGFARFGAALPAPLLRSILGWSSPHELAAPFRPQWVDSAMDQVVGAAADACAELCALEPGDRDSSAYFLLPAELERLRPGLKLFCEELMRPSAYHESFLLRGIYLTGDSSAGAVLQAPAAGAAAGREVAIVDAGERRPAFMRDIFERKVFAEVGLVRASRQRLRRPATSRLGNLAMALVPVAWVVGLAVGTVHLQRDESVLHDLLDAPPAPARAAAGQAAQSQALLAQFDNAAAIRYYAVAMPGSWPMWNELDHDIHVQLVSAFGARAEKLLRGAATMRLAELAGGANGGTSCALPAGWNEGAAGSAEAALELDRLPAYASMRTYLRNVQELDQGLAAMQRLAQSPPPAASGADLSQAFRYLLHWTVPPSFNDAAALYREKVLGNTTERMAGAAPEAGACRLAAAAGNLYDHLYSQNPLLLAEAAIGQQLSRLRATGAVDADTRLRDWRALQRALTAEQALLAQVAGQGAWMVPGAPGPRADALLTLVGASTLLGRAAEQGMRSAGATGLAGFRSAWSAALADAQDDSGKGLAWTDKAWAFSPERKQLSGAVDALLAPPYMRPALEQGVLALPAHLSVRWDKTQLDRAAALFEARKAFLAGPLLALPASLQRSAAALSDAALANAVRDLLVQAMGATEAEMPGAAADAGRLSVVAIRNQLQDIGALALAAEIDAVLLTDARVRLQKLTTVLDAAQAYLPRDALFSGWEGQKGAMFDAFGVSDSTGLNLYLDQQKDFIDKIVAQADGVLNQVDSMAAPGTAPAPAVATWLALRTDLARYAQKSPASSRLALEQFIRTGSADIDLSNCREKLGPNTAVRPAADLFAARLAALQAGLRTRCKALAGANDQRRWQDFAQAWNRDVGQRAPFAVLPAVAGGGVAADRDAVGAVLKLYDGAEAARQLAGTPPAPYEPQLMRVRELLKPLYPADDGQVGALDVAVEFRANPGAERHASQIIDWSLTIGTATLHATDPARPLRWEPGMPVTLVLRVARDAGRVPKPTGDAPGMSVADRSVTWRCADPWALFTLIRTYQRPDAAGDAARGPLLGFAFDLVPAPGAAPGVLDDDALAFVRLRLSIPGKLAPLAWPAFIPPVLPLSLDAPKATL